MGLGFDEVGGPMSGNTYTLLFLDDSVPSLPTGFLPFPPMIWACDCIGQNEPLCLGLGSQGGHTYTGVHTWEHYFVPSLPLETVLGRSSVVERGILSLCEWYPGARAQVCTLRTRF